MYPAVKEMEMEANETEIKTLNAAQDSVEAKKKTVEERRQELKALAAQLNIKTGSTKRGSVADYHY